MTLGNACQCRIVVYESTKTHGLTICVITKCSTKNLFISQKLNCRIWILLLIRKKIRNLDLFTEFSDSEIEITKVVAAGGPDNNKPTKINTKQENVIN